MICLSMKNDSRNALNEKVLLEIGLLHGVLEAERQEIRSKMVN